MKTKTKKKKKNKMKTETKMKIKMNFRFSFSILFSFCFSFSCLLLLFLSRSFCIFVNSTWPGVSYLAWKCHTILVCIFSTWPTGTIDGQLSLDCPRRAMAPSLFRICRMQWCCSLSSFLTENVLFGQIWSKQLKLLV